MSAHLNTKSQRATHTFKAIMWTMAALALVVFVIGMWRFGIIANTQASAEPTRICAPDGTCYRIRKNSRLVKPTA